MPAPRNITLILEYLHYMNLASTTKLNLNTTQSFGQFEWFNVDREVNCRKHDGPILFTPIGDQTICVCVEGMRSLPAKSSSASPRVESYCMVRNAVPVTSSASNTVGAVAAVRNAV